MRALWLVTLCGMAAPGPGATQPAPAADRWQAARQQVQRGQFAAAGQTLEPTATYSSPPAVAWHRGVLIAVAAATGDAPRARTLLAPLVASDSPLGLPARLAAETRLLALCPSRGPCAAPTRSHADVLDAPVSLQAAYLLALNRVRPRTARALAVALMQQDLAAGSAPMPARAQLLSAQATALHGTRHLQGLTALAWRHFPMEPAVAWLVRPVVDDAMARRLGMPAAVEHMEALVEARQNHLALGAGTRWCKGVLTRTGLCPALPKALGCRAGLALGRALRGARKAPQAEEVLAAVAGRCPEQRERARFLEGRAALAVKGGSERAVLAFERVAAEFPDGTLADDALVLAGEAAARALQPQRAAALWRHAVAAFPRGDMVGEALRLLAMQAAETGEDAAAAQGLAELGRWGEAHSGGAWAVAAYWQARNQPQLDRAVAGMQGLLAREPLTLEASLARGALIRWGAAVPSMPAVPAASDPAQALAKPPAWLVAGTQLADVGLDADAQVAFRHVLTVHADNAAACAQAAAGLLAAGDPAGASGWARRQPALAVRGFPTADTRALWDLAYPLAHQPALSAAAQASNMPVNLLVALAREESGFDARIHSVSGAVGLMQLLPATALTEALPLGVELTGEDALHDATLNARLGAAYLARMQRTLWGNPVLAVAAYNSGPGAVYRRAQQAPGGRLDLLMERYPVAETRAYVHRVIHSANTYAVLHGLGAPLVLHDIQMPSPDGGQ